LLPDFEIFDMNKNTDEHKHPDYKKIYYSLLILLVISIWGPVFALNIDNRTMLVGTVLLTAFGVGLIKATMVVAWFMHLDIEVKVVRRLLAVCIAFLILLFAGVAPEVLCFDGENRDADPDPIYEYPKKDITKPAH